MARFLKQFIIPLIIAFIVTVILACIFQTQRVIALLEAAGGSVSVAERLNMTVYDIRYLSSLYGVFIFLAVTASMTTALFLEKKFKSFEEYIYIIAGMAAMIIMLFFMKKVFFDVQLIAGARDVFGVILQAIAGGFGGKVFYRLRTIPAQKLS